MALSAANGAVKSAAASPLLKTSRNPAWVLEQVQRSGDAALGQQRGLHAVLGHEGVGDGLGGGNVAETNRRRGRGACAAQSDRVRQAMPIEPHQSSRHRRRDQARYRDAVPRRIPFHQVLAAAEDLVAQHDRRDDLATGRAGEFTGRERHRNVIAGMSAEVAGLGVHVVVEIENADEGAVGQGGIGGAGPANAPDHRALRCAAGPFHHREQRTRGWLMQRGKSAADGVEQQELGLIEDGRRQYLRREPRAPSPRAARRPLACPCVRLRSRSYPARCTVSRRPCHAPRPGNTQRGFRAPSARAKAVASLKRMGKNNKMAKLQLSYACAL